MFPLEQIMSLIPEGYLITILDVNGNTLFTASCPAMIPFWYRDRMVLSVVQGALEIAIKLNVMEVN